MVGDVGRRLVLASQQSPTGQARPHTGSSVTRRARIETTAPLCHACQPPTLGIVHSSTSFEHSGNTGENIKRMQGTKEYLKSSLANCISCVFFGHSSVLRVWWGRPHYRWRGLWQWMRMWSGFAEAT